MIKGVRKQEAVVDKHYVSRMLILTCFLSLLQFTDLRNVHGYPHVISIKYDFLK